MGRWGQFDAYDFMLFKEKHSADSNWVTTVRAHLFHREMNSSQHTVYFRNKIVFLEEFRAYVGRDFLDVSRASANDLDSWMKRFPKFVAKPRDGVLGRGVQLLRSDAFQSGEQLKRFLLQNDLLLLEEQVSQHPTLASLNPSSVNTVRIISLIQGQTVTIMGALLRMSLGSFVDNLAAGGIAAPIDYETGIVVGPAVSKMPDEQQYERHPKTDAPIIGFQVPHWLEVRQMIKSIALTVPEVRTVGWDIAISEDGPLVIEGNDNWDKTLWQIPHQRGLAELLENGARDRAQK